MNRPVVLIHYLPLEQYPPVMNLIEYIAKQEDKEMIVLTTSHRDKTILPFSVDSERIIIKRLSKSDREASPALRYYQFLKFYSRCTLELLVLKPRKIFYYETLSSFPAYLYWKYIKTDVKIYVHYHEYSSPAEGLTGMRLNRYFHLKEREMYSTVQWLSHTNAKRLEMFAKDEGLKLSENVFVMPNYPGKSWFREKLVSSPSTSIRIAYAGAVSRETMYFEDFVTWVISKNGQFTFDIYSNNISEKDREWLISLANASIRLHPGIAYAELPDQLSSFDIGVILYKGHIPNYVHNAPNKLFEYLACGLDVWVPSTMTGCVPYFTENTYPKVIAVDFTKLHFFEWEDALDKSNMSCQPSDYFYESEYPNIVLKLYS